MRRTIIAATITAGLLAAGIVAPAAATTNPGPTTTTTTTTVTTVTKTTTTTVPVVRRKSVVSGYASAAGYANTPGYGWVNVLAQTRHLDGRTYKPSAYSPVMVQRLVGRTWRTVITVTTGRDGLAFKAILAPSGVQRYRYIRPQGATVTAATSTVMTVYVPGATGR